ncbi:hypothetical protein [Amycolatopsis samaneae]|uniref:IrrE N-terminal-like domain-containing protein n=1 Tax=Amycolatopsis samaneae TaxID=664691 RepID=A0ABW5GC36_9PSEU
MAERTMLRRLLDRFRRPRRVLITSQERITRTEDVKRLVSELDLSATVTYTELAARLSRLRGRPIVIKPYPESLVAESRRIDEPLPHGVWTPRASADYVFYRQDTTPSHQRRIILHELGHICCRHVDEQAEPAGIDDGPPCPAEIARAVQRAGCFAADQEQAAETFAYLIERRTRPNLSATGDTQADRYRLLED